MLEIHYKWEIANLLHSISEVLSPVSILLKQTVTSLITMKTDTTFLESNLTIYINSYKNSHSLSPNTPTPRNLCQGNNSK